MPSLPEPTSDYAYVLGLYLGDGCISANGAPARGIRVLRIACADAWPGLLAECKQAVKAIRPANKVGTVQSDGCSYVTAYSRHWPCLIPQHGPGRKHDRRIELAPWQRPITGQYPDRFARGRRPLVRISAVHVHQRIDGHPRIMRRSAGSAPGLAGGSPAGTQSPWRVARPWPGWTNSLAPSTDWKPASSIGVARGRVRRHLTAAVAGPALHRSRPDRVSPICPAVARLDRGRSICCLGAGVSAWRSSARCRLRCCALAR